MRRIPALEDVTPPSGTLANEAQRLRRATADLFRRIGDAIESPTWGIEPITVPRVWVQHVYRVTAAAAIIALEAQTQEDLTVISNAAATYLNDNDR